MLGVLKKIIIFYVSFEYKYFNSGVNVTLMELSMRENVTYHKISFYSHIRIKAYLEDVSGDP